MKISVIIPVYNAERYINKCIDSVINQTYKNWEVIAIDDGSSDSSYERLREYELIDSRIKVLSQENKGPGVTRNRGISYSSGEYIVFLDSDDYMEMDYLMGLYNVIKKESPDVIFIDVIQESPDGKILKYEKMSRYKDRPKDVIIRHQMTGKLPWGGCRKAINLNLLKNNNIFYSSDTVGEEALYSFKVLSCAKNIQFISQYYYHYVNYPNSQSKKGEDDPWGPICKKLLNYLNEIDEYERYKKTINSFAFTSCLVSLYRIANNYNYSESLNLGKKVVADYKKIYSFDLDLSALELRVKVMIPFIQFNLIPLIILLSKVKKNKKIIGRKK